MKRPTIYVASPGTFPGVFICSVCVMLVACPHAFSFQSSSTRLYNPTLVLPPMSRSFIPVRSSRSKSISLHSCTTSDNEPGDMPTLCSRIGNITQTLVPAIPYQDDPELRTFTAHFRPRFIAKEFLYGARYMCDMTPLLLAGSIFGHATRAAVAALTTGSALIQVPLNRVASGTSIQYSVFHIIDNIMKHAALSPVTWALQSLVIRGICTARTAYHASRMISDCIITPIAEELSFRGICQYLSRHTFRLRLWIRAIILCGFGVTSALAVEALSFTSITYNAVASILKRSPALGGMQFCHLFPVVQSGLMIPPVLAMAKFVRGGGASATNRNSDNDHDTQNNKLSKRTSAWNEPVGLRRRIDRTIRATPKSWTKDFTHWQHSADQSAARYSRWVGASFFGASHGKGGTYCSQKIFRTIVSSLLVESRLANNRRTLWGSIGAHMFWNTMVCVLCVAKDEGAIGPFFYPKFWSHVMLVFPLYCLMSKMLQWAENRTGD